MAITFTSTKAGSSADYMRYLWTEGVGLSKMDRYMDSVTLDFALAPIDAAYVHLDRGSYIRVNSTTYPLWYTGFITNEAEATYLGKHPVTKQPVFGYKFQATADEYILSLKPLGVMPPFLNKRMGDILKALVNLLFPPYVGTPPAGAIVWDLSNIQPGPLVAQYAVTPNQTFKDVYQDLCKQASYLFYGNDFKLYFEPQDAATHGVITLDGSSPDYTPSRLSIRPSNTPIINDVTVLGKLEPQTYMHEYYCGTGITGSFPLAAGVWGADNCLLLDDGFGGNTLDTNIWQVYVAGVPQLDAAQADFSVFNNYLQCTNATDAWIQSVSAIPIESRTRFTHGEWDFLSSGNGVIASLWTQGPNASIANLTGCLYGIAVNGFTLRPIINGAVDNAQSMVVDATHRYVIRTIMETSKTVRAPFEYTYLDSAGVLQSVTSSETQVDYVAFQTLISEVDPATGVVVRQVSWFNYTILNGVTDIYGLYVPIYANGLDLTVGGISISIPVNCTLETATEIRLTNGDFDDWDDDTHPRGWINPTNVQKNTSFIGEGNSCLFVGDGFVEQDVSSLIQPGYCYNVMFRAQGTGFVQVILQGDGVNQGPIFSIPFVWNGISYALGNVFGPLVNVAGTSNPPLTTVPANLKLRIVASAGMIIDSFRVLSTWQRQLVGPNVMDAMDGQAPMATIVAGNVNSQTRSTYTGAPQYNPGQDNLAFFKNSVTLTSTVPPEDQIFRVSYRAAGSAIGRVKSAASILTEKSLWNDDGVRSLVRTDLDPKPRTSLECQLAAGAIVGESAFQHYEGTYTQYSPYFLKEPKSGTPIIFSNINTITPTIPFLTAEEVNEVVTTALTNNPHFSEVLPSVPVELFEHVITFGKPDHVRWFLEKLKTPIDSYQQTPATPYADPAYVDVTQVGASGVYEHDVLRPVLLNWDDGYMYFDLGEEPTANGFEVRWTDADWGNTAAIKNLVVDIDTGFSRFGNRFFRIQRNDRGRVFFMRHMGISIGGAPNVSSRYSTCFAVRFPVQASNEFVRDWGCRLIDTASPLVVGTDLAQNRYTVVIPEGDYVDLAGWRATLKTPGTTQLDLLRSSDGGITWVSLFPDLQKPIVTLLTTTGSGFFVRFLQNGDQIRYDCLTADGTAGGLELVLQGRVFTGGDTPLNTQFFSGTLLPGGGTTTGV